MGDTYEMKRYQRDILRDNRLYLIHNIYPMEEFWSALIEKRTLTSEMVEEIKVGAICIGNLLPE